MTASLLSKLDNQTPGLPIPVGGQASCGFPSPALDYHQPDLSLDDLIGLRPTSSLFLLTAWGDSMKDAGIFDGSILVVDKAAEAKNGQIIVAVVGAEFVVKRLVEESGETLLRAENKDYPDIRFGDGETLEVWGVVAWVVQDKRQG